MGTSAGLQVKGTEAETLERTTDLSREVGVEISGEFRHLLADAFVLYVKTDLQ